MEVFADVVNSYSVYEDADGKEKDVPIILFLNKKDLFIEKIYDEKGYEEFLEEFEDFEEWRKLNTPLPNFSEEDDVNYFNGIEIPGEERDSYIYTLSYIADLFREQAPEKEIIVRPTFALDTQNVEFIFNAVRDRIVLSRIRQSGIVV